MNFKKLICGIKNEVGFSLVEVITALGILGIVSIQVASMLSNQNKEVRGITESLAAQDLYKDLIRSSADSNICKYMLKSVEFDSQEVLMGKPVKISMGDKPIYASMTGPDTPGIILTKKGSQASSYSPTLYVKEISFEILSGTVSDKHGVFKANWVVDFEQDKSVRPNRPLKVSSIFKADVTNPSKAKVESCMNDINSPFLIQSCGINEVISGYDEYGAVICTPNYVNCPEGQAFSGIDSSNNPICIYQVITGTCPENHVIKAISATSPPKCVTTLLVNGACGSSHGKELSEAPVAELCSSGEPTNVIGSGPWSWACTGQNGGTSQACAANITKPKIKIACASYGNNCGIGSCNVTGRVGSICNDKPNCSFTAGNGMFGDPRDGCQKKFTVTYTCGANSKTQDYGPRKHEGYSVTLFCN